MKHLILIATSVFMVATCFWGCKNNSSGAVEADAKTTDSVYTGTKYRLPNVMNFFGMPLRSNSDSMTYEGVELGRRLFYDTRLSKSGTRSCASCHNYKYALSDSGRRLSINETGLTLRNTPALQNLAWERTFFWDGRVKTLTAQQQDAFEHELNFKVKDAVAAIAEDTIDVKLFKKAFGKPGIITEDKIYNAIEQFLTSAVCYNTKFDGVMRETAKFTPSEYRGYYDIFMTHKGECFECHQSPLKTVLLTDDKFHNNGLDGVAANGGFKDAGRGKITKAKMEEGLFKTPTLRNVALTAPYMHDGRFKTLMQVINFYSDSLKQSATLDTHLRGHIDTTGAEGHKNIGGLHFTKEEKQDLLNFLYTLTDTTFINNRAFKNPYALK